MNVTTTNYTTQLQAGLGMIEETRILLDLWHVDMNVTALNQAALQSGRFPNMSARRLRNVVVECFAPRYLREREAPAQLLQDVREVLSGREFEQLLFIYTCRANPILADFVREVHWSAYTSGHLTLSNKDASAFVTRANQDGKTSTGWAHSTIRRVAGYLTGCCADFGLLERGRKSVRRIQSYRIEPRIAAILAYDLHFAGLGDNRVVGDPQWALFGMDTPDVLDELKRLALKGVLLVQHAGGVTHIGWQHKTMKELIDALAQI